MQDKSRRTYFGWNRLLRRVDEQIVLECDRRLIKATGSRGYTNEVRLRGLT